MAKPNYNKIHGGMTLLLAAVIVNGLGVEFVEGKSLKHPKKGIVKTIESHESGDMIDCIDIYEQPAFDHPLLKNHTIQMKPTSYPKGSKVKYFQEMVLMKVECPGGTIPIKRTQNRISGEVSMVSKTKLSFNHNYDIKEQYPRHEHAAVRTDEGTYFGGHAEINVWRPATNYGEISISQIWLQSESGDNRNSIEAGWIVYQKKFGNETAFFIYWTANDYKTGCYNLECPGFVQVSKKHILGAPIRPISKYNSQQYQIEITIHQDQKTKNWWLRFHNEDLGYWPASILTTLGGGARFVFWGGEIINDQSPSHHSTTQMGSGHFPSEGLGKASFFRALKYIDASGEQIDADDLVKQITNPSCYDVEIRKKQDPFGVNFYYGGPGYSAQCP